MGVICNRPWGVEWVGYFGAEFEWHCNGVLNWEIEYKVGKVGDNYRAKKSYLKGKYLVLKSCWTLESEMSG